MFAGYDFEVIQRSLPYLFRDGMTFTLTLTAIAATGGIVFGTLLAMMRLSAFKPVSMLAGAYVNLMRSVPLVLVIFWFFFLVPLIVQVPFAGKRPPGVVPATNPVGLVSQQKAQHFGPVLPPSEWVMSRHPCDSPQSLIALHAPPGA